MKSHQLFICDMRLNVLMKTNFHISQCEDVGECHVFAVLCRDGASSCGSCRCTGTAGKAPGIDACVTQGQSPGVAPWCLIIPQCLSKAVPEVSESSESPS